LASNGRLNTSGLVELANFQPIESGAGGLARPDVAVQHALMAAHFERDLGIPLVVSEGYRSLERQQLKWAQYHRGGTLAAHPGTSSHGLAETIDYASGVGWPSTAASRWMDTHGPAYGFVADVPAERWHRHFAVRPTITPTTAVTQTAVTPLTEEDTDMLILSTSKGQGLLTDSALVSFNSPKDVKAFGMAGVKTVAVTDEFYAKLSKQLNG